MEKKLIKGSSDTVGEQLEEYLNESGELRHVTIFFDISNFLLTEYELLSEWVHMVLSFDNIEIQIESANCGYGGGGPNAAVGVLVRLGFPREYVKTLVFTNPALSFDVYQGMISQINTFQLFCENTPSRSCDVEKMANKIVRDRSVEVFLEEKKVRFYNPQRTHWMGFLNLLSYMKNIRMEYYIGEKSPLDGELYIGGAFGNLLRTGSNNPDIQGTVHCNLYLQGDNFSVACLIDRQCEMAVIRAVYLALTGEKLPGKKISKQRGVMRLFCKKSDAEVYERIEINSVKERNK